MLPNLNSLLSSATALVYKSLGQIQVDAAEMGIVGQKLMQDILTSEPELFKTGLDISFKEADDQKALGMTQLEESIASAAGTFGSAAIGRAIFRDAESPSQTKSTSRRLKSRLLKKR
jgi:hypothetical protein